MLKAAEIDWGVGEFLKERVEGIAYACNNANVLLLSSSSHGVLSFLCLCRL
jgi:hypothetical protein